jgi:hypothetical protein
VSGKFEQGSGRHSKENQDLHKVEKVAERGHQHKKKDTQARKEKTWMTLGGSSPSESRAAEINSEIYKPNVKRLLAEPLRS